MRRLLICVAACLAVACTPMSGIEPPGSPPSAKAEAIEKAAVVAADIADALNVAPPSTVTGKTTIDERLVRGAFLSLNAAANAIEIAFDLGAFERNSAVAKRMRTGLLETKRWLQTASAAQRAGQAASYREAVERARIAFAGVQSALKQ
ncbi:hypothetical protein [Sphingomonas koreensis]